MKKDKITTVRLNKDVAEFIRKLGLSPQKILDLWIEINIEIKAEIKEKGKE